MRRRDFLRGSTAAAAGTVAAGTIAAAYVSPVRAQTRNNTLLTLSESGPNNLDVMGIGTNRPGYEASWNTYDRLVTYGVKKDANGHDYYDHTKLEPELAEILEPRRHVGHVQDTQGREVSRRHSGYREGHKMVF